MRTTLKAALITSVLLLAGAGTTWALDSCFEDNFSNVLVGKAFKLPRPGNCSPFSGYFVGQNYTASGNACRTSDGNKYFFTLLSTASSSTNIIYTFQLPTTLIGGGGTDCTIGGGCVGISISKIICPNPHPFGL